MLVTDGCSYFWEKLKVPERFLTFFIYVKNRSHTLDYKDLHKIKILLMILLKEILFVTSDNKDLICCFKTFIITSLGQKKIFTS